ncbi:metallophosphoesterase [Chloroflexota bacterium]
MNKLTRGQFLKKKPLALLVIIALLVAVSYTTLTYVQDGDFQLVVLHTNDVHSHIDQYDRNGTECQAYEMAENGCFGGAARQKTMIEQIRAEGGNVVLLDAGDQFDSNVLFFDHYKEKAILEMMNALGYEAMVAGNNEFDGGLDTLIRFIDGANFPVLSANLNTDAMPTLAGKILPYTVLEIGGEKIGVVGYSVLLALPDSEESIQTAIDELTAQGINKILGVSHVGLDTDREIAAAVTGLDVVVTGHSHTYLSNTDPLAIDSYPVVIQAPDGKPVLLVSASDWGRYLGRLDVTFDADGVVTKYSGGPILLDGNVVQDPDIAARVDELAAPLREDQ